MAQARITELVIAFVLGASVLILQPAYGQCTSPICLTVEVRPNGTYSPQDISESRPLNLRFRYQSTDPQPTIPYSLRSLEYSVFADDESSPFFIDVVNLTDNTMPSQLDVSPGVQIPPDSIKIRVTAKLTYSPPAGAMTEAESEATVTSAWPAGTQKEDKIYDRMRDGYIRRHVPASGRGMSTVWLKEYEACVDSKDLLPYSRTQTANGRTRVYIPWTYNCTGSQCGSSVKQNSSVLYGGIENPLLRGGLAMAAFSNEYIALGDIESLNYALKLFEYIEKSEWRDPTTGKLTGFFLRSRWPGNVKSGKQYFYASTDELSGMSLGLLSLKDALIVSFSNQTPGVDYTKLLDVYFRLNALVDRLGSQLRDNFYLIVPLRKEGHNWVPIGLPVELQKGWAGTYAFEWFFSHGFSSVTGNDYSVPGSAYDDLASFLVKVKDIFIDPDPGDILELAVQQENSFATSTLLKDISSRISPKKRAFLAIQAMGIIMRHQGHSWSVPIPCAPDPTIDIPSHMLKRYNYAMLLHVFQLAIAGGYSDDDKDIMREMSRLIKGELDDGATTNLYMPDFAKDIYFSSLAVVTGVVVPPSIACSTICNCNPKVTIGGQGDPIETYDLYSASIARLLDLPDLFYSGDDNLDYWGAIERAVSSDKFAPWLPMAEREDHRLFVHNPNKEWGAYFCWEGYGDCILNGGKNKSDGLEDENIDALTGREIDTMREGSDVDYILPYTIRLLTKVRKDPSLRDRLKRGLYNYKGPSLKACTTNPVSLALADLGYTNEKCEAAFAVPEVPAPNIAINGTVGMNDWFVSDVNISIEAAECGRSAIREIRYRIDGGTEIASAGNLADIILTMDGKHEVAYYPIGTTDAVGRIYSDSVNIDKTPPQVDYTGNSGSYTVDETVNILCSVTDNMSGVATSTCTDVKGPAYSFEIGLNEFSAEGTDNAGNVGTGTTSFTVVLTATSLEALTRRFVSNAGIANSLSVKLRAAAKAGERGNITAKNGDITAYINEVHAQTGKALTAVQAHILLELVRVL